MTARRSRQVVQEFCGYFPPNKYVVLNTVGGYGLSETNCSSRQNGTSHGQQDRVKCRQAIVIGTLELGEQTGVSVATRKTPGWRVASLMQESGMSLSGCRTL